MSKFAVFFMKFTWKRVLFIEFMRDRAPVESEAKFSLNMEFSNWRFFVNVMWIPAEIWAIFSKISRFFNLISYDFIRDIAPDDLKASFFKNWES